MRIAFKFRYLHGNGLFARVLEEVRTRSKLPVELYRAGEEYRLEASGTQEELESLAEQVSVLAPQSLFLRGYAVEASDGSEGDVLRGQPDAPHQIPCCPECERKVVGSLDPFEPCSVCGFSDTVLGLEDLCAHAGIDTKDAAVLFRELGERLIAEGSLSLPTYNGIRRFSLLGSDDSGKEGGVLLCDPANISADWVITQGELDALMTIEKPSIRLKPKLKFRAEHALSEPFYPVFFADDTVTLALAAAVSRRGIASLLCDPLPPLRVAAAGKDHAIIRIGRDMAPWHHRMVLHHPSCCTFGGERASGGPEGVLLHPPGEPLPQRCVRFVPVGELSPSANPVYFEPAHAALRSVVLEHDLQQRRLCGIYLSREHRSQICSFSPKIGYTPMAAFSEEGLSSPAALLASIAGMDESGGRLVANYQKTFPRECALIAHARFDGGEQASALERLWAMAALFIGLWEGGNVREGCERLEAASLEFTGKSGPRIDYKVIGSEGGYLLDPRPAIRSAMSFKLAGVDGYLLSYGFIDSLADFIARQAEIADANVGIEGVVLGGSLFENRQLLACAYHALTPNYRVYRNERLGMDGANVAVGAVALGSE